MQKQGFRKLSVTLYDGQKISLSRTESPGGRRQCRLCNTVLSMYNGANDLCYRCTNKLTYKDDHA